MHEDGAQLDGQVAEQATPLLALIVHCGICRLLLESQEKKSAEGHRAPQRRGEREQRAARVGDLVSAR